MRLLRPLRTREIALLWGGLSLSAVGDQLYTVTLSWVAVAVFGSAAGYLTALQAAVVLLAALGLGRWVDRWSAQRTLITADLVRMVVLLGLVRGRDGRDRRERPMAPPRAPRGRLMRRPERRAPRFPIGANAVCRPSS